MSANVSAMSNEGGKPYKIFVKNVIDMVHRGSSFKIIDNQCNCDYREYLGPQKVTLRLDYPGVGRVPKVVIIP